MNRIKILLLGVFLFSYTIGYAQKQWSLAECIENARENNLSIRQQQLSLELSSISLTRSKASFLPSINASASHNYNYGRSVDRFTNQFATDRVQSNNFYVSANLNLFNGFQLLNTWKLRVIELEAGRLELQQLTDDISLSIATAYLQILFNRELFFNAQNQYEITAMQMERTQKLYNAGAISRGDMLTVEAQLATEELQVINADNQLKLSILTLAQMLDLEDVYSFDIQVPDIALPDSLIIAGSASDIYAYAVKTQPEILASELRVNGAEKSLAIAKGGRYPSLSLSSSIGTGYSSASSQLDGFVPNGYDTIGITSESLTEYVLSPSYDYAYSTTPFMDQIGDNVNKTIGLNLTIPLFNGLNTYSSVEQARINLEMARISLDQSKLNLQKTIQQAHADATAALKRYFASKKQVEAMRESFHYMQEKFNVGLANALDYNDAKNKLIKAESDMLQAKYEYIFRIKILDFYLGRPIVI